MVAGNLCMYILSVKSSYYRHKDKKTPESNMSQLQYVKLQLIYQNPTTHYYGKKIAISF